MAEAAIERKISLKILVNVKSKKVVCAEAGMVGCLEALYKSIESLDAQYYQTNSKDSVLKPKGSVVVPLLSFVDSPKTIRLYRCGSHTNYATDYCRGILSCPSCRGGLSAECSYSIVAPTTSGQYKPDGYVKGAVKYMVMDNLEVKPMSLSLIQSLVKDFDYMEERQVELGPQQGLVLLKASLETQAVLTTVFLRK
ncbi:Quinolinate synthase A [Bienertia sinuspersici]